jgi:magnesium chelatase subunit D
MSSPGYPFAAIVGQPDLKLALLLASIDWRLSLLLKGDKGSGKSTAARALADILPAGAPFVNIPIGTTEDRLLGGLNLGQALKGQESLKPGLIHEAHGGVLYIDEVNLLSDSLTDALLDVASSGQHYVERDGFSVSSTAQFILLGSMNIEEGALRPQLLDRFALSLDVEAPSFAEDRALIVDSRLHFDADPAAFCATFEEEQQHLRQAILDARALIPSINPSSEILRVISQEVTNAGVRTLRADLAALRAATARAALDGRPEVVSEDIQLVLPLVLHHRTKQKSNQPSAPSAPKPNRTEAKEDSGQAGSESKDRVFPPEERQAPELRVRLAKPLSRGQSATMNHKTAIGASRPGCSTSGEALDAVASFAESFRKTGAASLNSEHLIFRKSQPKSGVRFIFVVDASGSHAAQQRMRAVKGAAAALLESSVDQKDEVAVISFRGAKAAIVLEPCRDAEAAIRVLEFLPTGGRTPLAHALELAGSLITPASLLVLLTDGRANVPLTGTDPWADALEAARKLNCPSVLVDSSLDATPAGATAALASAMRARLIHLDSLSNEVLMSILQDSDANFEGKPISM